MSETEHLFGDEHVRRYRETNGEVGHIWRRGSKILLHDDGTEERGGSDRAAHLRGCGRDAGHRRFQGRRTRAPGWYRNLLEDPAVTVQILGDVFPARARTVTGNERERLWKLAAAQWPDYDVYQTRTDREIPVVVLERD